jgi:alpha-glucosidase (family GH31 glycosyl hydrolase)
MVKTLKEDYQFRVTLWIHPFINLNCPSWYTAAVPATSFLVRDTNGKEGIGHLPGLVWWWQGELAGYIDFTNPQAVHWWRVNLNLFWLWRCH